MTSNRRKQLAMFDALESESVKLSNYFQNNTTFEFVNGDKVTYAYRRVTGRDMCQECTMVVHEAKGGGPIPRRVAQRRTLRRGKNRKLYPILDLCNAHAQLWKARDGV